MPWKCSVIVPCGCLEKCESAASISRIAATQVNTATIVFLRLITRMNL